MGVPLSGAQTKGRGWGAMKRCVKAGGIFFLRKKGGAADTIDFLVLARLMINKTISKMK